MSQISTRIHPAVWLVYLFFYPLWPLIAGARGELIRGAVVIGIFLPIYLWAIRQRGWQVLPALIAIAGLGVYGCRSNLGAAVFFIYAAALGVRLGSPRRAFCWLGVLLLAEGGVAIFLGSSAFAGALYYFLPAVIGTVLIGLACIHEDALEKKNEELRQSRDEVARLAKIAERERIARDLHDLLGHTLSLVVLKSQLAGRLFARGDGRAGAEIAEVERIARQALQEVRTAVAGWRSAGLAAEIAGAALACEMAGVRFEAPAAGVPEEKELPPLVEAALAMSLREAVTNVLRHAEAKVCQVRLEADAAGWRLEVEDDGRGLAARAAGGGQGLKNISERAVQLGGEAAWSAAPGGGTRLRLELPRQGGAAFEALDRPAAA